MRKNKSSQWSWLCLPMDCQVMGADNFDHGDKDFEKWIVKDVVDLTKEVIPHSVGDMKLFISGLAKGT